MARMRLEARLFSVTYWSTTIVVMATFDSAQLASLRSLTEVFGPMCLILEGSSTRAKGQRVAADRQASVSSKARRIMATWVRAL